MGLISHTLGGPTTGPPEEYFWFLGKEKQKETNNPSRICSGMTREKLNNEEVNRRKRKLTERKLIGS